MLSKAVFIAGLVLGGLVAGPVGWIAGSWKTAFVEREKAELRADLVAAQAARDAAHKDLQAALMAGAESERLADARREEAERLQGERDEYADLLARTNDTCRALPDDARYINGLSNARPASPAPAQPAAGPDGGAP